MNECVLTGKKRRNPWRKTLPEGWQKEIKKKESGENKMEPNDLREFVLQAQRILEEKKVRKRKSLYVGALEREIEIESLTEEEIEEWVNFTDRKRRNLYLCYLGSPSLRELAAELVKLGQIEDYVEVVNILEPKDKAMLFKNILELSGILGKSTIREVEA